MTAMSAEAAKKKMEELGPWYHIITHPSGVETPGKGKNVKAKFERMVPWLEGNLEGKTVLDLGANACGLSLEFAKRGARVTAVESGLGYVKQAEWIAAEHGVDITIHHKQFYQISEIDDEFDYVLFMGLIYHLRHPQLGLDLVASRCRGRLFMNTPIIVSKSAVMECRLPTGDWYHGEPADRIPASRDARYNYWFASPPALDLMMRASGFANIETIERIERPFRSSSKHERNESDFETGQIWLTATAAAHKDVLIDMARREPAAG